MEYCSASLIIKLFIMKHHFCLGVKKFKDNCAVICEFISHSVTLCLILKCILQLFDFFFLP